MCATNSEPIRWWCWKDAKYVEAESSDHKTCLFQNHDLELEGIPEENVKEEKGE